MSRLSDEELRGELLGIFTAEADDQLGSLNERLLALEKGADPDARQTTLDEIMRLAHNLKGASAAVGVAGVTDLAHRLETIFGLVQKDQLELRPELFDLVYQSLDAIGSLVGEAATGTPSGIDAARLSARLGAAAGAREEQVTGAPPSPRSRAPEPRATVAASEDTVRVATAKLDGLMAELGELLAARIGMDERLAELRALARDLMEWEATWGVLRPQLRRLARLAQEGASAQGDPGARASVARLVSFVQEHEAGVRATGQRLSEVGRMLEGDGRRLAQATSTLEDDVRRVRMLPIATLFDTFPRMVRDLARKQGKEVDLVVEGADTEVDRSVLEQLRAPLTHLLRNAVDHGLEEPDARAASGKPRAGTVLLAASQRGGALIIEATDDGAGIDPRRVVATSVEKGLLTRAQAESLNDGAALRLVFRSGLSTSPIITDVSGRGVGLDVVRDAVEAMNGVIEVDSVPGEHTRFCLTLPLSVATTRCLLLEAGGQTFALPTSSVVRIVRVDAVEEVAGREAILVDGEPVAVTRLADVLHVASAMAPPRRPPALILGIAETRMAFIVDAVTSSHEVVVKGLPRPLERVRYVAGVTILGNGEPVMVLNAADLLRSAPSARPAGRAQSQDAVTVAPDPPTILLADDSITTRTLEKNILEAAGYDVRVAADGVEAWNLLRGNGCDLVVSDVQMPGLDGFELTEKIRGEEPFRNLPVVLVTSLDSSDDRRRGVEAGADAYIVKSAFDQDQLLDAIRRLV